MTTPAATDRDAQDLAEPRIGVLRVARRVARAAAVAGRDVEQPVGAEGEPAAIVVGVGRVRDRQQRRRSGDRKGRGVERILDDADRAGAVGRIDDEPAARREIGPRRDAEQAALAVGGHAGDGRDQRPRAGRWGEAIDRAAALDQEHRRVVAGDRCEHHRLAEPGRDAADDDAFGAVGDRHAQVERR